MSEQLVSDELWRMVKPLLPAETSKARGGRPRIPDRTVLSGIVFVLRSGIPWRMLPKEMGFGSGVTKSWPGRRHSGRRHERVTDALFHSSLLGIRSTNVEPRPSSLSTAISPPWASAT